MEQPEEEQQVVVIGEAASAATLLLQKLNEYLGSNSSRTKGCVHKALEGLKCQVQELIRQFVEEEASRGCCYDNAHDHESSAGSDQDGLQQEEESWTRKAKRVIYDIEDEVDQIMTIQYRNSIVPESLRFTFTNCCSIKKHLTAICSCSCVKKHWTDIRFCRSHKKHLAAIRQLQNSLEKISEDGRRLSGHHISAAPTVDDGNTAHDNGDNSAAISIGGEMKVTGPGVDEVQDNLHGNGDNSKAFNLRGKTVADSGGDEGQDNAVADDDLKEQIGKYLLRQRSSITVDTVTLEKNKILIGRFPIDVRDNKNLDIILKFLGFRDSQEMIVVTGKAGIGKTFLVNKAFDTFTVKTESDRLKWISYDPSLERKENLANLYESPIFAECKGNLDYARQHMSEEGLIREINSLLSSKYLALIVDDVPDVQHVWKDLIQPVWGPKKPLSRLMFITRNVDSANAFRHDFPDSRIIHIDQELNQKEALDLLHKTAFRNQEARPTPDPLEKVAEAIVTRDCHGVPLPIVTAATQLAMLGTQPNAWHTLRGNLMKKRPLPATANSDNDDGNMFMLCYNALCFPLKHILLYCCFFQGGREIPTRKLQRLCVAEGFVADDGDTTAEDATKNYLEQLIQCQLIVQSAVPDKPETCRIRDTDAVRKLAALIVEEEEYREFCSYTRNCKDHKQRIRHLSITGNCDDIPPCSGVVNIRHLSITGNSDDIPSSSRDVAFLRSCFVSQLTNRIEPTALPPVPQMREEIERTNNTINELVTGGNRLVRVLDFTGAEFIEKLPDQLGDLVHLRYLGLRGTKIKKLPASASRLPNLQSLDIRDTEVTSLPSFIMKYGKFRHLHFAGSFVRKVVELHAVEKKPKAPNLQTLAGVRATELLLGYLEKWTQLRKLSIGRVKGNNSAKLCACINLMKSLRSLTIKTFGVEKLQMEMEILSPVISLKTLKIGGRIESLSHFGDLFPSLTRLYLWDSELEEDPFECLKSLENLVILCLSNACCRKEMKCCKGRFPELKKLSIQRMRNLELLEIENGGMESLEIFFVGYCPKLKPTHEVESKTVGHLGSLRNLKLVQISRMSLEYAMGVTMEGNSSSCNIQVIPPNEYEQYFQDEESKKNKQEQEHEEYMSRYQQSFIGDSKWKNNRFRQISLESFPYFTKLFDSISITPIKSFF